MDEKKTGALIRRLRLEKGLTQRELAQLLHVSDKAVSKWERAQGCPDISLLPRLADVFGVQMTSLLNGTLDRNDRDGGNMKRIRFYVCPDCGNVMTMTGEAEVSCCGRRLEALKGVPCDAEHALHIEPLDGEMYITFEHGMSKAHHIRFVACVGYDRVMLVRLYPEQGGELRMPYIPRGTYYVGCSQDGLFVQKG